MIIIGAKGHAKEILDVLQKNHQTDGLCFFDNISNDLPDKLFGSFNILKTIREVESHFKHDDSFILGLGSVKNRYELYHKFTEIGGKPVSAISNTATVGTYDTKLGKGLNIMHNASVFNSVSIGTGTLLNAFVSVHHDCRIGEFCEISPGARILGRVTIGNFCSVGSNAVILPDVVLGDNVVIGAGAVVTKDTEDNSLMVGLPAKKIKKLNPLIL